MKKKLFLSPLIILIIIIVAGVSLAGASLLIGNSGDNSPATAIDLQRGLVGWWKFDGNAKDATPNSNNGTVTGAVLTTDRKGQANKAYSFDGASDIDFGSNSVLDVTTAMTVLAWVKPTNTNSGQRMIATHGRLASGAANDTSWHLWQDGTGLHFRVSDGVTLGTVTTVGTAFSAGQWVHVALRFDGGAATKAVGFINGVQTGSAYNGVSTLSTNPFRDTIVVGADGDKTSKFFVGVTDDVRIYNRALTANEVTALYQEYNPGIQVSNLQKGLVGQWKMDGNAKDATPNSNNGTVTGAKLITDRKGQANRAYDFTSASSQYIRVGASSKYTFGTGDFSISVWVKLDAVNTGTAQGIVRMYYDTGVSGDHISAGFFEQSGNLTGHSRTSAGSIKSVTVKSGASTGTWYHLVVTRESSTVTGYLDGAASGTPATGADFNYSSNGTVIIGANSNTTDTGVDTYLDGQIDEVRIYNRALSASEVSDLYSEYDAFLQVSNLQKGLIGYWALDGDAKDKTPYQNNGTVNGAVLNVDRKGQINKAYNFNGSSDYIGITDSPILSVSSAFTLSAWIYPKALYSDDLTSHSIIRKDSAYVLYLSSGAGSGGLDFYNWADTSRTSCAESYLTKNTWQMVTATWDGTSKKIYVNGVQCNSVGSINFSTNTNNLSIGASSDGSSFPFNGFLDDVRIYNRALSSTEIADLYNSY